MQLKHKSLAFSIAVLLMSGSLVSCDKQNTDHKNDAHSSNANSNKSDDVSKANKLVWSDQEKQLLLSFSIRELPDIAEDLSNKYQTNPQAVVLGAKLFFDARLSDSGTISCSVCHQPNREFSDGLKVASGLQKGKRNTPSILGAAHQKWFFWDGRKDSLWAQALAPFEDATEHNLSRTRLIQMVLKDPDYQSLYEVVFDEMPDAEEFSAWPENASPNRDLLGLKAWKALPVESRKRINRIYSNLGKAIAAYEATLKYKVSRFDQYLDDLREAKLSTHLRQNETEGLKLFIGKGQCSNCHFSPLLSSQHFQNIGTGIRGKDMGRSRVAETQAWDIFSCLGEFSDAPDPKAYCKELSFMSKDRHGLSGSFKVPSLRNVSNTAPYLHDGRFKTLKEVVSFYVDPPSKNRSGNHLPVITLDETEQAQLVAFLRAL